MKNLFSKKSLWHKAIVTATFTCFVGLIHAQSGWTTQSTSHGVTLSYKVETCSGTNALLLQFQNSNGTPSHASYTIIVESPGLNIPLPPQFIQLKANETKAGTCDSEPALKADIKGITNPVLRVVFNAN